MVLVQPTAKSLILDLLSSLKRGAAPVSALIRAAELFDIGGNSLRVALARLCAAGLVESDARGCYRLGARAEAVNRQIVSWRGPSSRLRGWSGGWIGAHSVASRSGSPRDRRVHGRALRLMGFRTLEPGLEVRPDNLVGGVAAAREQLAGLGLAESATIFGLGSLDDSIDRLARSLWDTQALCAGYREFRARLEASFVRLPELPRDNAMRESFVLGGEAIRRIALDPLLPDGICPQAERKALIASMRRYDRLGRRCWLGWLGEDSLPERIPADVHGLGAAESVFRASEGGS
jgi:phenylacetic acid degradation operon negative regulatory protein